jgi:hypothetical protein
MAIIAADSHVADQIVQELVGTYQVTVVKDWGEQTGETGQVSWNGGEWSLDELHTLQKGIVDLATAMGGPDKFTRNLGSITINQVDIKYRGLASSRGVKFTTSAISIDAWTVVHELSHVWDAKSGWRLSKALERYTGGRTNLLAMALRKVRGECDVEGRMPGCNRWGYFYGDIPPAGSDQNFNRKEDFAESVTAYVYPAMVQARVDRFKDGPYRELLYYADYTQTRRWAFVDDLIKQTIPVE